MLELLWLLLTAVLAWVRPHYDLVLENLLLRHQVAILTRSMSRANPLWGTERIKGELLKLGNRGQQSLDSTLPLAAASVLAEADLANVPGRPWASPVGS